MPVPQFGDCIGPDACHPRSDFVLWPSGRQHVGQCWGEGNRHHSQRDRFSILETLGAVRAEVEEPKLSKRIAEAGKIDAVLDLVGNSTILDSLDMLRRGGRACLAGWLGGLAPIADFNPLLQMASGVYLTFFGSFVFGKPGFPLSDVPLQAIAAEIERGRYKAKPTRVFRFEEIQEAHRVMESNEAKGKLVVVL